MRDFEAFFRHPAESNPFGSTGEAARRSLLSFVRTADASHTASIFQLNAAE